jgi:hypothetical protein
MVGEKHRIGVRPDDFMGRSRGVPGILLQGFRKASAPGVRRLPRCRTGPPSAGRWVCETAEAENRRRRQPRCTPVQRVERLGQL